MSKNVSEEKRRALSSCLLRRRAHPESPAQRSIGSSNRRKLATLKIGARRLVRPEAIEALLDEGAVK